MAVAALEPFGLTAERAGVARVRHARSRLHCHWHFDRVYACGGGESYAARQVVTTAAGSGEGRAFAGRGLRFVQAA
jgi:hypothetical protein